MDFVKKALQVSKMSSPSVPVLTSTLAGLLEYIDAQEEKTKRLEALLLTPLPGNKLIDRVASLEQKISGIDRILERLLDWVKVERVQTLTELENLKHDVERAVENHSNDLSEN